MSTVILGSQSPRRFELLSLLVDPAQIVVQPPLSDKEESFDGLTTQTAIQQRVLSIAKTKNRDVVQQRIVAGAVSENEIVLTADTVVMVEHNGNWIAMGKPDGPNWRETARTWLRDWLPNRDHFVVTGVCISTVDHGYDLTTSTRVRFCETDHDFVEWYLDTEESIGKAGGYGIQAAGEMFVEQIEGSISNVIGLPLKETWEAIREIEKHSSRQWLRPRK